MSVIVARVAAVPLGLRSPRRIDELTRVFGEAVELIEATTSEELAQVLVTHDAAAVVIDSCPPGCLSEFVAMAADRPVLRPLWVERRNSRQEIDRVFSGYGLLVGDAPRDLGDGELRPR
jgi:hypothetical protein